MNDTEINLCRYNYLKIVRLYSIFIDFRRPKINHNIDTLYSYFLLVQNSISGNYKTLFYIPFICHKPNIIEKFEIGALSSLYGHRTSTFSTFSLLNWGIFSGI